MQIRASLERPIEIEVAVERPGPRNHPSRAAAAGLPDAPQRRQQRSGQAPRLAPEQRIGGHREVSQHRHGGVPVLRQLRAERGGVERADLG